MLRFMILGVRVCGGGGQLSIRMFFTESNEYGNPR